MIDVGHREPHTAAATFAFFGVGQVFNFLGDGSNLAIINQVLSILSFVISITVGVMTIARKLKQRSK